MLERNNIVWKIDNTGVTELINNNGDICIQLKYLFFINVKGIVHLLHSHIIEIPHNSCDNFIIELGNQLMEIVINYLKLGYFNNNEAVIIVNDICRYDIPNSNNILEARIRAYEIKNNKIWL